MLYCGGGPKFLKFLLLATGIYTDPRSQTNKKKFCIFVAFHKSNFTGNNPTIEVVIFHFFSFFSPENRIFFLINTNPYIRKVSKITQSFPEHIFSVRKPSGLNRIGTIRIFFTEIQKNLSLSTRKYV